MENALVAISNGEPVVAAKKFWVGLKEYYGSEKGVLANRVIYKDGLVMLEGVKKLHRLSTSPVKRAPILGYLADWKKSRIYIDDWRKSRICIDLKICVEERCGDRPESRLYAVDSASLIFDRALVHSVEGMLDTSTNLDPSWNRSLEEAQALINKELSEINARVLLQNSEKVPAIADLRREVRAYAEWRKHFWLIRLFMPLRKFVDRFPESSEDAAWVISEAKKLGIEFEYEDRVGE